MTRGIQRERQVRAWLQEHDYWVCRAAGSMGDADLVALKPGDRRLVEVKSTAQGPYERFGPAARDRLRFAAELADCSAWLAWWPSRGRLTWIPAGEWPVGRGGLNG